MYGPTGVGFLYGKREMLVALPPANFGGPWLELAWMDRSPVHGASRTIRSGHAAGGTGSSPPVSPPNG